MSPAGNPERHRLPAGAQTLAVALAALLGLATMPSPATAAEAATVARDTELRAKPLNDAPVLSRLKAKATITITSRSGAWAQVTAGGQSGYVRLFNLRTSSGVKGDSGVGSVASVFRTGSSGASVSTGVKGLSATDITGAAPDEAQLKELAGYAVSRDAAAGSAKSAGLAATAVEWLPAAGKKKKKKKSED